MGIRKGGSFTATMIATAIGRCTSFAAGICWRPSCARPIDGSAGALEEVARVLAQIRRRWPAVRILLRADSGFARDELMTWCEANGVDFLFALARNPRLVAEIAAERAAAAALSQRSGKPARRFRDFTWRTLESWLEPGTPGRRQGGVDPRRSQSPFCRHLAAARRAQGAPPL
jgi:hypothetical protein